MISGYDELEGQWRTDPRNGTEFSALAEDLDHGGNGAVQLQVPFFHGLLVGVLCPAPC